MKWVLVAVVSVFLLLFGGLYLVGMTMFRNSSQAYASASSSGYAYGSGPEWDKLRKAESQGPAGFVDLQALMLSSDPQVANSACQILLEAKQDAAYDLFFEQLPKIGQPTKDTIRYGSFQSSSYAAAATRVKDRDKKTKEGARFFLNLSYGRDAYGVGDAPFNTLVQALPGATEKEAGDLAYTLSLFRPSSAKPLVALLTDKSPLVRKTAATVLGKMGRQDALADVSKLKSDPDPAVRKAAALAETSISSAIATASAAPTGTTGLTPEERTKQSATAKNSRKRLGMP